MELKKCTPLLKQVVVTAEKIQLIFRERCWGAWLAEEVAFEVCPEGKTGTGDTLFYGAEGNCWQREQQCTKEGMSNTN